MSLDTSNVHKLLRNMHVTKSLGAEFGALQSSDGLAKPDFLCIAGCIWVKGVNVYDVSLAYLMPITESNVYLLCLNWQTKFLV